MAPVLDFPVNCTEQIKEAHLSLLVDNDIQGRVTQAAIFFLSRWNLTFEAPNSLKRIIEEFKGQSLAKQLKVKEAGLKTPQEGQKDSEVEV